MFLENELAKRGLPPLLERDAMLALLSEHLFGQTPEAPPVTCEIVSEDVRAVGGKALYQRLAVSFPTPKGPFSFPAELFVPHVAPSRLMIYIAFHPGKPDRFFPAEEILDQGVAIAMLGYTDVTSDDADFNEGLAACYPREKGDDVGKIGLWAFAASRLLDGILQCGHAFSEIGVAGHSRLGKTALWCGAQDQRITFVVSNDSGAGGAAIARDKVGESVAHLTDPKRFHYWFCKNYRQFADREADMPFDQHMLLACIAPRLLYVASASEDTWADPTSEFLSALAASKAYGGQGLQTPDRYPLPGELLHTGKIGYHMRRGHHYFGREDWNSLLAFWFSHRP